MSGADPAAPRASLPTEYFEQLYADDPDPWRFETSPYEREKYDATLDALPRPRFAHALEVGCANGVLTRRLAERCDVLLAVDVAETALARARARCAGLTQVTFRRCRIPEEWPEDGATFDLILLSEVLYYLSRGDLARLAGRVRRALAPAGAVLLVHYVLPTDYPLSGDEAAEGFIAAAGLTPALRRRQAEYRLDLLLS